MRLQRGFSTMSWCGSWGMGRRDKTKEKVGGGGGGEGVGREPRSGGLQTMTDDFMPAMIESDFDVQVLGRQGGAALFGAQRTDVWHFVHWAASDGKNLIKQVHIPRYVMASAVEGLSGGQKNTSLRSPAQDGPWVALWNDIGLSRRSEERVDISWMMTDEGLPALFCKALLADLKLLGKARGTVKEQGNEFVLPGHTTHLGNPIAARHRGLVEAIAFEYESRGVLDAEQFALYSAFCTMRDFPAATDIAVDTVAELFEIHCQHYAAVAIPEDVLQAVMEMQRATFATPIWGPTVNKKVNDIVGILSAGIRKLSAAQQAQVSLLSGMYNVGVLVVLATILGFMSFERYVELRAEGLQPDSGEEQELRTHMAYIELLGKLCV